MLKVNFCLSRAELLQYSSRLPALWTCEDSKCNHPKTHGEIKHDVCFLPRAAKIPFLPSAAWRLYAEMSRFMFVVNGRFLSLFFSGIYLSIR